MASMQLVLVTVFYFILQLFSVGDGYPFYRDKIPNGHNVTNPCNTSSIWMGVGHKNEMGGGERNSFGQAFAANQHVWNADLCNQDSDGDGRTNGDELGDPDCIWTEGATPTRTSGITHPGICDPLGSNTCMHSNQSQWLSCTPASCPAFDLPTTKKIELMFPRTEVPAKETTYMCMGFELPNDMRYNSIGTKAVLDNVKFPHHMLIYGCSVELPEDIMTTPQVCQMTVRGCFNLIGAWTMGLESVCYPDDVGIAFGLGSFKYVVLQIHWNNPQLIAGEFDASGMAVYYTDQIRPNEAIIPRVGQLNLNIPPGQQVVEQVGYCTPKCTNALGDKKLQIIGASIHMHLLGRWGEVILTHNGVDTTLISEDFSYNSPLIHYFKPYYNFSAGDQIKVTCRYDSTSKNKTLHWGESTSDEMCYVFMVVIPTVEGFIQCGQYKSSDVCDLDDNVTYAGCDYKGLQQILGAIGLFCNTSCTPQCMQYIQAMKNTKCMDIEIGGYIREFWAYQDSRLTMVFQVADYCMAKAGMTTAMASGQSSAGSGAQGSSMSMGPGMSTSMGGGGGSSMSMGPGMSTSMGGGGGSSMSMGPGMSTNPGAGGSSESMGPGMSTSAGGTGEGGGGKKWPVIVSSAVAGGVLVAIILLVACCPWDRNSFSQPAVYSSRQF